MDLTENETEKEKSQSLKTMEHVLQAERKDMPKMSHHQSIIGPLLEERLWALSRDEWDSRQNQRIQDSRRSRECISEH